MDCRIRTRLQWIRTIPHHDADVMRIMISYVHLRDEVGANFTDHFKHTFELFCQVRVAVVLNLNPNMQHVINFEGVGLPESVFGTTRIEAVCQVGVSRL